MIDLRHPLPTGIEVGGVFYRLKTDFRIWVEFLRAAEENGVVLCNIFDGDKPDGDDWVPAAMEFAKSENPTPRNADKSSNKPLDLILDGDYIVGAFMQVYGVDLTSTQMHWHLFLALLRSLPEGCKLTDIMGYRTFKRSDLRRKPEQLYIDLQRQWALPVKPDQAIMEWQEQMYDRAEKAREDG